MRLLKTADVCEKLAVSRTGWVMRVRPELIAAGKLRIVQVGGTPRYLEHEVDELIREAAETGRPLGK
jgi:hypothetical protein